MNLSLSQLYDEKSSWGNRLLYLLSNHKKVQVSLNHIPIKMGVFMKRYPTSFLLDDLLFFIDDTDFDEFIDGIFRSNFIADKRIFILKIQYNPKNISRYDTLKTKRNIQVIPFTMFAHKNFPLEKFRWNPKTNHRFSFVFIGALWEHRKQWIEFFQSNINEIYIATKINMQFMFKLLEQSKWGLILKGYGNIGKNMREVEFSSLGLPLILNYTPYYPFSFEPNIDYVYIKQPSDILSISNLDTSYYSERSYQIYKDYFSPNNGIYNSFKSALDTAIRSI